MTTPVPARPRGLGLPVVVIVGLALLASVRGVLHDLHLTQEGEPFNLVLVVVPPVIWVVVAVIWSRRPFVSLLAAGILHGALLGLTHVVLWDVNLAAAGLPQPSLGGNLEGVLPPLVEAILLRGAVVVSSLAVGLVLGAVAGIVAWAIRRIPGLPTAARVRV